MRRLSLLLIAGALSFIYTPARAQQSENLYCRFEIGPGSPMSGTYQVSMMEDQAFAFNDFENDLFVIEIHGDNYMDLILILEKALPGKHIFTMEMQVAIDISTNEGEDYYGFDNHQEEGGGYIQIDRLDDPEEGYVTGSFSGLFNDGSTGSDQPIQLAGTFSVKRI